MTANGASQFVEKLTKFEDIRVEAIDSNLIDLEEDMAPPGARLSSAVKINGVHFMGFTVQGKTITSQTDANATWNINSYVSNITFQ